MQLENKIQQLHLQNRISGKFGEQYQSSLCIAKCTTAALKKEVSTQFIFFA